jgi:hypothetical protein
MDMEALRELTEQHGYAELLELIEAKARARENAIIKVNLDDGDINASKLLIMKARAEGARQLAADLTRHLENLRPKSKP